MKITKTQARKVLEIVDQGLSHGVGNPIPGQLCVEAAVSLALGLPHGDDPKCVGSAVRSFKIQLNDSLWSSNAARAKGMRKLAVAQLGSDKIDQKAFAKLVAEKTIRQIVPVALRLTAKRTPKFAEELEAAAHRCEVDGTREAALQARNVARKVRASASTYATYAASTYATYAASAYATYAATASADASAYAAADADAASAYATYAATASADASAAADYSASARDKVLTLSAECGLEALIELKSPGCKFLSLCE